MVKCPRCGYENSTAAMYCDNCAYLLADSDGNKIKNSKREGSWNMGLGKKIVIVLGIIVVAFLLFSFIYNNSQPTAEESLNLVTDDGSHHQTSSYPYDVVIKYDGSWYGEMGDPNYLLKESKYGNRVVTLDCASWEKIHVHVQKQDYSYDELKVQLLRNGEVVVENTTTDQLGSVEINYN